MNPLIQGYYETAPKTSRNAYSTNQGTNEDDSESDPHPEAGIFQSQTIQNSGPEEGQDLMTGVHEEVTYCSRFSIDLDFSMYFFTYFKIKQKYRSFMILEKL